MPALENIFIVELGAGEPGRHRQLRPEAFGRRHDRRREAGVVGLRVVIAEHGIKAIAAQAIELTPVVAGNFVKALPAQQ